MRKYLLLVISTMAMLYSFAQQAGWQNKDFAKDSVFGISSERAIHELAPKQEIAKSNCGCHGHRH